MAQQNTDLPEGTDKVVSGAGAAGGGTTGTTTSTGAGAAAGSTGGIGGSTASAASSPGGGVGGGGGPSGSSGSGGSEGGDSGKLMDKVRSGGEKLSGQAADKARGLVGQGLERSSEALSNVGRLVNDTASGLDERLGPEYGDYARRAAEAIDRAANNLASKNPDELIDDTRQFVRKSPGVALAGAAVVGFAVARLLKSGLSGFEGGSDNDRGSSGGETGIRGGTTGTTGATGTTGTTGTTSTTARTGGTGGTGIGASTGAGTTGTTGSGIGTSGTGGSRDGEGSRS